MKSNKFVALAICIACFVMMLVGCTEAVDDNQYWLDKYKEMGKGQPAVVEDVTLDFYIIKGDGMSDDANITKTVQDKINQYLSSTYHTSLNIKYISESDYAACVNGFTEKTSGIVLINSYDTMEILNGMLVDLHPYIHGDQYKSHSFGQLNKQISTALMNAALVEERGVEKLFCLPNNHVIGNYELIVIDKELAFKAEYPYSDSEFAKLNTWESTEALRNAANQIGEEYANVDYKNYDSESGAVVTKIVNAPYESISAIKESGYIVNVAKYPIADKAEVYSSALAVLNASPDGIAYETYKLRAMQVLYAINTNVELRNLLQYGVENVNYSRDTITNIITPNTEKPYDMKIEYTGDVFKAYYSDNWTEFDSKYGLLQNKDAER